MYHVAICEDNQTELAYLEELCRNVLQKENIPCLVAGFSDTEALERDMLSGHLYDLLLLDIEMDGRNGMDFARQLRRQGNRVSIIFTTGSRDYLQDGYSIQPIHYLLKPITEKSLAEAVLIDISLNHTPQTITLYNGTKTFILNMNDIYCMESTGHRILVYEKQTSYELPFSMKKMTELLPVRRFCRCHNGFLVNMQHISKIRRTELLLTNGQQIPVGRRYYTDAQKAFIQYLNQSGE